MQRPLDPHPSTPPYSLSLGIPVADTIPILQSPAFKELVNKLAWAIGTTYDVPYTNTRCQARIRAVTLANMVLIGHGYPRSCGYPK